MLLIENGYVVDPKSGTAKIQDVFIKEGRILKVGENLRGQNALCDCESGMAEDITIIDAKEMVVMPGLIDVHSHFRDPGFTYKEDILTGAKAAAAGGYTTVVLMANTKPCVDNTETLKYILNKGHETDIRVETCACVTMGLKGQEPVNFDKLYAEGAVGFTDDGIPITDYEVLKQAMVHLAGKKIPISLHEEDPKLIDNNGVNRGTASKHYGIGGSPRDAEIELVKRDIALALETGAVVNFQHISTKEAVELIRDAKLKSENIHAEACPHHFTLTEEAVIWHGTLAKMNPPLRTEEDRAAIVEGLIDGTLDIIATDHAPHSVEEKAKPITEAPSGIIGLETALSLSYMELVDKNGMDFVTLANRLCLAPAAMYGLKARGYLQEGALGDVVIFDPKAVWVAGNYLSKSSNTPFTNKELKGVVKYTICNGQVVYDRNKREELK